MSGRAPARRGSPLIPLLPFLITVDASSAGSEARVSDPRRVKRYVRTPPPPSHHAGRKEGRVVGVAWSAPLTAAPLISIVALMRGCYGGIKQLPACTCSQRQCVCVRCWWGEGVDAGGGSAGRLFCGRCCSDDETLAESLNSCIGDELSLRLSSTCSTTSYQPPSPRSSLHPGTERARPPSTRMCTCALRVQGHVSAGVHSGTRCVFHLPSPYLPPFLLLLITHTHTL